MAAFCPAQAPRNESFNPRDRPASRPRGKNSAYLPKRFPKSGYLALPYKLFAFMEYGKIVAVTGLPGLYELLSSKNDGAIVRSLDDKSTRFVASRTHSFSHLESIEVYTVRENINLIDILQAMEKDGEKLPDTKDNAALKKYFAKVYPDLDFERVYNSDLKKMVKWFETLKTNGVEIKPTAAPAEEAPEAPAIEEKTEAPVKEKETQKPAARTKPAEPVEPAEEKPKKTAKKKAAPDAEEKAAAGEAPKKKAAPKSKPKEETKAEAPKKKAAPKKSK